MGYRLIDIILLICKFLLDNRNYLREYIENFGFWWYNISHNVDLYHIPLVAV